MTPPFRVIAFPFAGGSSFSYTKIARALPPHATLTTLDPPGHGRRIAEPLLADIGQMAVDLAPRALQEAGALPYVLFGHSMGAYLALAVYDRLQALGAVPPLRLVLSGAAPPQREQREKLSALPQPEFLARVEAMGGMPSLVRETPELLSLFAPILRADFSAAEGYDDARVRTGATPVRVLRGTGDRLAAPERGSWSECFARRPEFLDFPGGHFFLFDRPAEVAAAVCGGGPSIDGETGSE